MSSLAGFQPSPMMAVYSATKAFVTSFTEAVHEELKGTGVAVTVLCPGFTRTGFQESANVPAASELPGFVWQEADEVAVAGLDALAKNRAVAIPGALNKVLGTFSSVTPARDHAPARRHGREAHRELTSVRRLSGDDLVDRAAARGARRARRCCPRRTS